MAKNLTATTGRWHPDTASALLTTVFDIGMFDGADTAYYLQEGHRVLAVEANPTLAQAARERLAPYVDAGQLNIVNAAISDQPGSVELFLSQDDLGASSLSRQSIEHRNPHGAVRVRPRPSNPSSTNSEYHTFSSWTSRGPITSASRR